MVVKNNADEWQDSYFDENRGRLTIQELRTFPGCEHYSDEQAEEIVESIYQIALLVFDIADWKRSQEGPSHMDGTL
ncbi:hypothetical protein GO495_21540 [Chitinophaga oryziterrae]|uniref:Uncharacterized protein n=1 Tax=Chitinophaga oryziterrae TaxID=1031224 RepID=A0A6N8JD05_9BACT|nr:hypothetical protein [Chitinophaga oryziterrae]MVT43195.1 hypothetical protein [Chitinophaga oryziterrae]